MTIDRVGLGFDIHPFAEGDDRPLVLGGVTIENARGLSGHSDADVVAHAVADALLGAANKGDLGEQFPATDERWRDADSMSLLGSVVEMLSDDGWWIENVDCSVILQHPQLGEHKSAMRRRMEQVIGASVSVKACSPEGVGALGHEDAIACSAIALVRRSKW